MTTIRTTGPRAAWRTTLTAAVALALGGCIHIHVHEASEGLEVEDVPPTAGVHEEPVLDGPDVEIGRTRPVGPQGPAAHLDGVRVHRVNPSRLVPPAVEAGPVASRVDRPGPSPLPTDLAAVKGSIDGALDWLARHQAADGSWTPLEGETVYKPGVTGLALLALLGDGNTHRSGRYQDAVKRGLRYLRNVQDAEGCIGPRTSPHFMYNHGYAALALVEAYGTTHSPVFKEPAARAVGFVQAARNPYLGWRYGVRDGDNDTPVTGLMTMVLRSGVSAGLVEKNDPAFQGALGWVEKMTEPTSGRTGYQHRGGSPARMTEQIDRFPADESESLTAIGIVTRVFCGQDPATVPVIRKGAALLAGRLPAWSEDGVSNDFYYWYYGTLASFQVGGRHWDAWRGAVSGALTSHQRSGDQDPLRGSWDPLDPWGTEGGRVYATAMGALCLEIVARGDRLPR